MKQLILPITTEKFAENWNIVDQERRKAKKKCSTGRFSSFFSQMVLAVLTLFSANGLIHDHMHGSYCDFLEDVPFLLPVWHKVSGYFLKSGQSWLLQCVLTALVVFVLSFLVCCVFTLLVTAIYHPRKTEMPQLSPKENAEQLLSLAKDARGYSRRTAGSSNVFWILVFLLCQFLLVSVYLVVNMQNLEVLLQLATAPIMKLIEPYLTNEFMYYNAQQSLFVPSLMIYCFLLYFAYALIAGIHTRSINFLNAYHIPYSFVADVEYHWVFSDENTEGLSDDKLRQQREIKAQEWLNEGLEMEKICAYGKAKELYARSAHSGNPEAMEHYARIWLIANAKDPARYWLERCVSTGNASETAVKNLRRMKWRRKIKAAYIKA